MERVLIHVRVQEINKDWLAKAARDAGLSAAQALDALLTEAREAGVTIRASQVIRP